MNNSQAMRMVNSHLGYPEITNHNTSFSNINKAKHVWWININPQKFSSELHILLAKNPGLIWLKIKANTFSDLESVFRARDDNGYIDLEISVSGYQYLRDIKSGGAGYDFKPHIEKDWSEVIPDVPSAISTKTEIWPDYLPELVEDGPKFEGADVCVENLFAFLDNGWNLYSFLKLFPSVSAEQALAAIEKRMSENIAEVIHSDRKIMSGSPVFKGTRLPVKSLFDHMAAGYSLDAWLGQFPTASKEQATTALDIARYALERQAYESAAR